MFNIIATIRKGLRYDEEVDNLRSINKQLADDLVNKSERLQEYKEQIEIKRKKIRVQDRIINEKNNRIQELGDKLQLAQGYNSVDNICRSKPEWKIRPGYAYKAKILRQIADEIVEIPISVGELIDRDSWLVKHFFSTVNLEDGSMTDKARRAGDKVARNIAYTTDVALSEQNDYYYRPNEVISSEKGDCEDHAFLVASAHRGLAVAYGEFRHDQKDEWGWHAFNVFVDNGRLKILETTGHRAKIYDAEKTKKYRLHKIFTKQRVYKHKDSNVRFGEHKD